MAEFEKIEDFEQLENLLKTQDVRMRRMIAARASLRSLPGAMAEVDQKVEEMDGKDFVLSCLRATLITGVASTCPSPVMKDVEKAAAFAADSAAAAFAASSADFYATSAAFYATVAAASAASALYPARSAAFYATARSASVLSAAFRDVELGRASSVADVFQQVLWPEAIPDQALLADRQAFAALPDPEGHWTFWKQWYAGMLAGEPMDWDLQLQVALIDEAIWDAGVEAVAQEIERIEARFLIDKAPLSETVELNPETGKFRVVPLPMENAGLIGAMLARTGDAVDDALLGRNGLREESWEVRTLRRTHERYGNDPQRIEMDYTSVAVSLRWQIDEIHELEKSADNLALLNAVEEGARAIRAHHPDVARNRDTLAREKLREMRQDGIDLLEDALPLLIDLSEGVMQEDFARDIPKLINDATLPVPSGAPPLPGMDETTRIFNRVSRIKLLWDNLTTKGGTAFDSKEFKTVRLVLTVTTALSGLIKLGRSLIGVM